MRHYSPVTRDRGVDPMRDRRATAGQKAAPAIVVLKGGGRKAAAMKGGRATAVPKVAGRKVGMGIGGPMLVTASAVPKAAATTEIEIRGAMATVARKAAAAVISVLPVRVPVTAHPVRAEEPACRVCPAAAEACAAR